MAVLRYIVDKRLNRLNRLFYFPKMHKMASKHIKASRTLLIIDYNINIY
jgi:hypothetical protein